MKRFNSADKHYAFAYLIMSLGVLVLGFAAIIVRSTDAPGTITAFYRMAIASILIFFPFLKQNQQPARIQNPRMVWFTILGGIFFGLDMAFWSTGVVMSGAAIPTFMANTAPLWVGLGSKLILDEDQGKSFWLGLLIALAGAGLILGQDFTRSSNIGLGGAFGLLGGLFYGAYFIVTQQVRSRMSTLSFFWISSTSAALTLLIINLVLGHSFFNYNHRTFLMFVFMGIIVQVLGWLAINYSQGYIPAVIVSTTLLAQPVLTAISAWFLLEEILSHWQIFGCFVVILGVYFVNQINLKPNGKKLQLKNFQ